MNRTVCLFTTGLCAVVLTAGCSASLTSTTVKTTGVTGAAGASVPSVKAASAHVGTTITLDDDKTMIDGQHLAVTLVKVATRPGASQYNVPSTGMRFYAVQFRLRNTGSAAFSDTPGNGAKVLDSQGQQFDGEPGDTTAGPPFGASPTVVPGGIVLGWVTFEVPRTAVITGVQYALDSGFGSVGQWTVP